MLLLLIPPPLEEEDEEEITVRDSLMLLCDVILGEGSMGLGEGVDGRGWNSVGVGGLCKRGTLSSVEDTGRGLRGEGGGGCGCGCGGGG